MPNKQIKIYDFTKFELECFKENCNFTDEEMKLFNYRSKYLTLEQIAEKMNISSKTAYRINKRVKDKIVKVCVELDKEF